MYVGMFTISFLQWEPYVKPPEVDIKSEHDATTDLIDVNPPDAENASKINTNVPPTNDKPSEVDIMSESDATADSNHLRKRSNSPTPLQDAKPTDPK